jgi:dimethylhistidine N-methyltransferase
MSQFLNDVLQGLSAKAKYLNSKYFYDETGDELFQKIMACPEYYPTQCEMEIFTSQTKELASVFTNHCAEFDVIELGAGDASKSIFLLNELLRSNVTFTYFPVDISRNVIQTLHNEIPKKLPSIQLEGLNGEYFNMLEKAKTLSNKVKVVLFLGGNIGNVPLAKAYDFCKELRLHLSSRDLVLIGLDLKKDPQLILDAYNDKSGYTKNFNLNLLRRINKELSGNFILENFYHFPTYDPATGACKSYLVSIKDQSINIADHTFSFAKSETIFMEIAQKYTVHQTDDLARDSGFIPVKHFLDSKNWFLDTVWQCV